MGITFPPDDSNNKLAFVPEQCMDKKQRQEALRGLMSAILAPNPVTAMLAPTFAPFPQADVRRSILPREWEIYLESWTSLAELYLRLNERDFVSALTGGNSLTNFINSFFHQLAKDDSLDPEVAGLRRKCFLLIHRIYSGNYVPIPLLNWLALSDICHAFPKSEKFRALVQGLWKRKGGILEHTLQDAKYLLIKQLESKTPEDADPMLYSLAPLLRISPDAGIYLLTGSDFLDSLSSAYPKVPPSVQKKLIGVAYIGLVSLLEGPKPNYSLLSDHLYSLKNTGEKEQGADPTKKTFLADLVTNTPLLSKIHDGISTPEGQRVKNMAASLSVFRQSTFARPKKLIRRKVEKGKGKAISNDFDHGTFGEIHIHRMSLVSQIQDLFPDLGSAFVVKLLDEYNENIEEVTGHLLEDSLPPRLANANRGEQLYVLLHMIRLTAAAASSVFLRYSSDIRIDQTPHQHQRHILYHDLRHHYNIHHYLNDTTNSITMNSTGSLLMLPAFTSVGRTNHSLPITYCPTVLMHPTSLPFSLPWQLSTQTTMNATTPTTSRMLAVPLMRVAMKQTRISEANTKRRYSKHTPLLLKCLGETRTRGGASTEQI
jgi:hypothetical protein